MNAKRVIDNLGGTAKVAELLGLTKSAVSQWKKRGIPAAWVMYLKKVRPKAF
jgi:predicted transcriptional regulator